MPKGRDFTSSFLAIVTFLFGLAMVGFAFYSALQLFQVPPAVNLQIEPGKTMNVNNTVQAMWGTLVKVVMLILMAVCGSIVANRGVKLYEAGRPKESAETSRAE